MGKIVFKDISFSYGKNVILKNFSLEVEDGQILCLVGPSGCGKTTLVRCLLGLNKPDTGEIWVGDTCLFSAEKRINVPVERRNIGIVFQDYAVWPHMTVAENVLYPLKKRHVPKDEAFKRAHHALEQVKMVEYANHLPSQLSGGQQQRVAIARALINDPEIIMADEPTGNLDSKSGKEIMELLIRLNKEQGKTIILVTHDPKIGKQVPRVISVFDGMLGSEEEQQELKRWTDANYSKLDGLAGDKAALGDDESGKASADVSHETRIPDEEEKSEGMEGHAGNLESPDGDEPRRTRRRASRKPRNMDEEAESEGEE